jgi:hypothetical protein
VSAGTPRGGLDDILGGLFGGKPGSVPSGAGGRPGGGLSDLFSGGLGGVLGDAAAGIVLSGGLGNSHYHVDCRLNFHYSLDVIFCLSFLVTAREGFSQGRAFVKQLVSRFLKDLHLVLDHGHLSTSSGAKFNRPSVGRRVIAGFLIGLADASRFPPFMVVHLSCEGGK